MLLNIAVVENFVNFTGKYLWWSLFFNKVLAFNFITRDSDTGVFLLNLQRFFRTPFFTEHLRWLLLENLFRLPRERRLHITAEIYTVIWQRLLLLLVKNVSSCIWRTLIFGCLSYFYKGDQTEAACITKSMSLRYFAITCYWRWFYSHWR